MSKLTVVPYTPDHAARWDDFVLNHSANGTFLQSRRFLSYHPQGRFTDASVMVQGRSWWPPCPPPSR